MINCVWFFVQCSPKKNIKCKALSKKMYKMCMKEFSIFRLEAKQEMFNKIPKKYFFLFFFNNEDFSFFN